MNANASAEDIVKDALSVRDEGQEPRLQPHEYEHALLSVAHREQKPSEDFPTALSRVVRTDDNCDALIFAASRRRAAEAAASEGKSAPSSTTAAAKSAPSSAIASDAERVAKGAAPTFTRAQYEDEMMALSKAAARAGESPAVAFARLAGEGHFDALYAASVQADEHERAVAMTKAAPSDDGRFHRLLVSMAQLSKRSGETLDAACARLLAQDPIVQAAYDSTQQGA